MCVRVCIHMHMHAVWHCVCVHGNRIGVGAHCASSIDKLKLEMMLSISDLRKSSSSVAEGKRLR